MTAGFYSSIVSSSDRVNGDSLAFSPTVRTLGSLISFPEWDRQALVTITGDETEAAEGVRNCIVTV